MRLPHLTLLVVAASTSIACVSSVPDPDPIRVQGALQAGLAVVEATYGRSLGVASAHVAILLPESTPPVVRAAAASLRTISTAGPTLDLPRGSFLLKSLTVRGSVAILEGVLGPVLAPGARARRDACGQTFEIPLSLDPTGAWVSGLVSITQC